MKSDYKDKQFHQQVNIQPIFRACMSIGGLFRNSKQAERYVNPTITEEEPDKAHLLLHCDIAKGGPFLIKSLIVVTVTLSSIMTRWKTLTFWTFGKPKTCAARR